MPTDLTDDDIARIARGVIDRSLPKAEWTHAAHFAAALALIAERQVNAATEMPDIIRAYNIATGVANTDSSGYHETITQASLRVAGFWLAARPGVRLSHVLRDLLASPYGRSDWLLAHWSKACLFSVQARRSWQPPDLAPLPF